MRLHLFAVVGLSLCVFCQELLDVHWLDLMQWRVLEIGVKMLDVRALGSDGVFRQLRQFFFLVSGYHVTINYFLYRRNHVQFRVFL